MYDALVIARQGKQYIVEDQSGQQHQCHARNKAIEAVCGDIVSCNSQEQSLDVIESIQSRKNQITRLDNFKREKILAANVDHVLIVVAAVPEFSELFIDKYLACTELIGCKASLIINKCELLADNKVDISQLQSIYENICANVLVTSAKLGYGITQLRKTIHSEHSVLVGQSGVGKSSLVNRLLNSNQIKVADLSEQIQQGTHTTSHAWAHSIGTTGKIIDSPGVRSFTPIFKDSHTVMQGFKDFLPFINKCKFTDCLHIDEPDCAIKQAVDNGNIHRNRYSNYLAICAELENT